MSNLFLYPKHTWKLSCPSHAIKNIPMKVPGDILSALIKADIIADPYFADNEIHTRWIGECEWHLQGEFYLQKQDMQSPYIHLCMSFVDTFATVIINDKKIGMCDNAFAKYRFDVTKVLHEGRNTITIVFDSPVHMAKKLSKKLSFPIPNHYNYKNVPETKHMNLLRKPQCHGGWDWGITLMVSGIYNALYLEKIDTLSIESVGHSQKHVYTKHKNNQLSATKNTEPDYVFLDIAIDYVALSETTVPFEAFLFLQEKNDTKQTIADDAINKKIVAHKVQQCTVSKGKHTAYLRLKIEKPQLWWPTGYGAQVLYTLQVGVSNKQNISPITQMIGLRELHVINKKDTYGRSFEIHVNNRAIFCKGANWIPCDAIPQRQTKERYTQLIMDMKKANMNMLRIWGGGQYEKDIFYELCDREGILIWHDLMFACSLYPSHKDFLSTVQKELEYQIPRLQHHPCIALWCGDNEIIGGLEWYPESQKYPKRYLANYLLLNDFLRRQCKKLDTTRHFWASSPYNGHLDFGDAWHNDTKGDMHFWEVWHAGASFEEYRKVKPRFCSEFGFQSFPSLSTISTFTDTSQHNVSSPHMEHHQKNANGNAIITEMFMRYFRLPSNFYNQLYLSQVQQALAICFAIEYWRSSKPICSGILYWQLNDNWPVASWSSIEHSGKWKLLHYRLIQSFSPVLLTSQYYEDTHSMDLILVNDLAKTIEVLVKIDFYDLRSYTRMNKKNSITKAHIPIHTLSLTLLAEADSDSTQKTRAKTVQKYSIDLTSIFDIHNKELYKDCLAHISYTTISQGKSLPEYSAESIQLFRKYKYFDFPNPTINIDIKEEKADSGSCFSIHLQSKELVLYSMLDLQGIYTKDSRFSDNGFTLIPYKNKQINYYSQQKMSISEFKNNLCIYHLGMSYR